MHNLYVCITLSVDECVCITLTPYLCITRSVDERVRRRVRCACDGVCRKGGSGKRGRLYDIYIHIYVHTYTFCALASVCCDTPLQARHALPFTNYTHAHTYLCLPFVNYTRRMYVLIPLCRPTRTPLCALHTRTHVSMSPLCKLHSHLYTYVCADTPL